MRSGSGKIRETYIKLMAEKLNFIGDLRIEVGICESFEPSLVDFLSAKGLEPLLESLKQMRSNGCGK